MTESTDELRAFCEKVIANHLMTGVTQKLARDVLALLARLDEKPYKLPCDVRLPPATTIRKGCDLSTLLVALEARDGENAEFRDAKPAAVPEFLTSIGKLLVTQDNRITDQPLFAVQQKRRIYGIDPDYGGEVVWVHSDGGEADKEEFVELENEFDATGEERDNWTRTSFHDEWEFVTACFTEQGCKDYLAINGHNLKEPRIYAYGSCRNNEYQTVRKWLMSLAAAPEAQPVPLMYEDDLPESITDAEYGKWFQESRVVDGVRMGSVFVSAPAPKDDGGQK